MADDRSYMSFIRVTLLGMAKSGKSSLVNNVVNNSFSAAYTKTEQATLFYTTVRIAPDRNSEEDKGQSTLMEIEDTYASNELGLVALRPGHIEEKQIGEFYDFWWPSSDHDKKKELAEFTKTSGKKDDYGIVRSLDKPLGLYKPPTDGAFRPLTKNRMAFLIIFDSNDEESYKEGVRVYEELDAYHKKKNSKLKPVIYFVANKVDLDPTSDVFLSVTASAKSYADFNGVPYREVSANQYKGVKKLFRNVVQAVLTNQKLWMLDLGNANQEEEGDAGGKCSLQ